MGISQLYRKLYFNVCVKFNADTLKACSNVAYGFNHRDYNHDDCVLKGRRISLFLGLLLKKTPSLQDGRVVYHLPVVETTGYIALSLRDREKVNLRIMEITELNIIENPVIPSVKS